MINIVEFLARRGKKEHGIIARIVATLLGATLFLAGIPAFVFWAGQAFMNQPILPVFAGQVLSRILFALGVPWVIWSVA